VLLVDEPFVGLDQPGRAALLALVREAAESEAAVLVSTHQTEYLAQANRLRWPARRRLVYDGKPTSRAEERSWVNAGCGWMTQGSMPQVRAQLSYGSSGRIRVAAQYAASIAPRLRASPEGRLRRGYGAAVFQQAPRDRSS